MPLLDAARTTSSTTTTVVHVDGMTGVGKTYLCSQLAEAVGAVRCHDLDDLVRRHGRGPRSPAFRAELSRIVHAPAAPPIVVLVGSVDIPKEVRVDHRIVLTVPEGQRSATYRRMLLRNLDNVLRYKDRIEEIVRSTRAADQIMPKLGGLAINTRLEYSYEDYSRWVDETVRERRKRGYVPMTRAAALRFVLDLSSQDMS